MLRIWLNYWESKQVFPWRIFGNIINVIKVNLFHLMERKNGENNFWKCSS
jgi:hypothetical protein